MNLTVMDEKPKVRHFATTPDGQAIEAWTLTGPTGLELEVITLGATARKLVVPGPDGKRRDFLLGFDSIEPYLDNRAAFSGAIAGRIAGRVPQGRIVVDGKEYDLPVNDGQNHLHGGVNGLHRNIWQAEYMEAKDGSPAIQLKTSSPDGHEGYPGRIEVTVVYALTAENAWLVETSVTSDAPTPVSLTQHAYFNLGGEGSGDIQDHELAIYSDETIAVNESMTPLGKRVPVRDTPCDLNKRRPLGDVLPDLFEQHGDLYWLRKDGRKNTLLKAASLHHPGTNQTMETFTTHDCLQFYSGAGWDGSLNGKSGKPYPKFAGLCLETEGYPAATTHEGFGDIIVRPGTPQLHQTLYRFF